MEDQKQELIERVSPYIIDMLKMYLNKREYLFFVERYGLASKRDLRELRRKEYQLTNRQKRNINTKSLNKLFQIPGFGKELYAFLCAKLSNKNSLHKIYEYHDTVLEDEYEEDPSWWIPVLRGFLNPVELEFAIKRYNLDGKGWRSIEEIVQEFHQARPALVYSAIENKILSKIFSSGTKYVEFYEYLIANCPNKDIFEIIKTRYCNSRPMDFNYQIENKRGIWCDDLFISFRGLEEKEILLIKRTVSHPFFMYLLEKKCFFDGVIDIVILTMMLGIIDNNPLSPLEISYLLKMPLKNVISIIQNSAGSFKAFYKSERQKPNFPKSALFLSLSPLDIDSKHSL